MEQLPMFLAPFLAMSALLIVEVIHGRAILKRLRVERYVRGRR
jgi:hypothetical protein